MSRPYGAPGNSRSYRHRSWPRCQTFNAEKRPDSMVSFAPCQWNLIKTFQIEVIVALITKMALIFL